MRTRSSTSHCRHDEREQVISTVVRMPEYGVHRELAPHDACTVNTTATPKTRRIDREGTTSATLLR